MFVQESSRIIKVIVLTILAVLLLNGAWALEDSHYNVYGYDNEIADFKITQVIDTFNAKDIDRAFDAGVIASPSSKVILENPEGSVFEAYRLQVIREGIYGYNPDEKMKVHGNAIVKEPGEGAKRDIFGNYRSEDLIEKTVKIEDVDTRRHQAIKYKSGAQIILEEPGEYYILFRIKGTMGATEALVRVVDSEDKENLESETVEAIRSKMKLTIDGEPVNLEAYNIDGNNFFRIRDLAFVFMNTEKEFAVDWDLEDKTISISKSSDYSPVGGEMEVKGKLSGEGKRNIFPIIINGEEKKIGAYNVDDNTYFKLRDLAMEIDFGLTWDAITKTISIETSESYEMED